MFQCQECQRISKPREPSELVVVARHLHTFPARPQAHRYKQTEVRHRRGRVFRKEGKVAYKDDPGGVGYQIDREIRVCAQCVPKARARILKRELEDGQEEAGSGNT